MYDLIAAVIDWDGWNVIETLLTATGIMSLVLACVRFKHNSKRKTWCNNVSICDRPFDYDVETVEYNAIYSDIWTDEPSEYMSTIVFKALDCVIPKLEVISLDVEGSPIETVETFKDLTPNDAVCFRFERAECIPLFKLRWYSDYGEYAEHVFSDNMRNGINSVSGAVYQSTWLSTIKKVLRLK